MLWDRAENQPKRILIIGGMGPKAGVDLHRKIIDATETFGSDHEHFSICHLCYPSEIPDRLTFLQDPSKPNPGPIVADMIEKYSEGVETVVGIPCNTFHAPAILEPILERIAFASHIHLVHIIREMAQEIKRSYGRLKRIGILCSLGAYQTEIFPRTFEEEGVGAQILIPHKNLREGEIHASIYHKDYGVKARSAIVDEKALNGFEKGMADLHAQGAELIVLGCTEIPLAVQASSFRGIPLLDSTEVLAVALIRAACSVKCLS